MDKIQRVNATQQVVDAFRTAIQKGTFKTGDRLPNETEIAKELGVGRSSLREALKILNVYGVIESRHGEGTFIVDNRARNFFKFLGFERNKENIKEFMELRRVIEVGNIISICGKLSKKELDYLESQVKVFEDKPEHSIPEYVEADKNFHAAMISYSHNTMLEFINNMITDYRIDLLQRLFEHEYIVTDARVAHRSILEALKKGDVKRCIETVTKHIEITVKHVDSVY